MMMIHLTQSIILAATFVGIVVAAPAAVSSGLSASRSSSAISGSGTSTPSSSASASDASPTVPYASDDPNEVLWNSDTDTIPQAIRGSLGATVLGPQDVGIVKENPDLLAPPTTDAGTVYVDGVIIIRNLGLSPRFQRECEMAHES